MTLRACRKRQSTSRNSWTRRMGNCGILCVRTWLADSSSTASSARRRGRRHRGKAKCLLRLRRVPDSAVQPTSPHLLSHTTTATSHADAWDQCNYTIQPCLCTSLLLSTDAHDWMSVGVRSAEPSYSLALMRSPFSASSAERAASSVQPVWATTSLTSSSPTFPEPPVPVAFFSPSSAVALRGE